MSTLKGRLHGNKGTTSKVASTSIEDDPPKPRTKIRKKVPRPPHLATYHDTGHQTPHPKLDGKHHERERPIAKDYAPKFRIRVERRAPRGNIVQCKASEEEENGVKLFMEVKDKNMGGRYQSFFGSMEAYSDVLGNYSYGPPKLSKPYFDNINTLPYPLRTLSKDKIVAACSPAAEK
ncbi:hypothetical protein TWF718_005742 [Orbilia javanica]|uniref:Uncharacterized protein n=1 Tax=Orbilia javanica TaxID=47235 RepID=A0AAN8RP51_9PEZI